MRRHLVCIITIFTFHSTPAFAVNQCLGLFIDFDSTKVLINDLIETLDVKRRLFQRVKSDSNFLNFFNSYTYTIDSLYEKGFAEIVFGQIKIPLRDKDVKERILHQQIKIMSLMDPKDLSREFQQDFIEIVFKVYDPFVTTQDLEKISNRLDVTLSNYSKM